MAQISEKVLKKSLEVLDIWFVKLQNIHFAPTPADFIVLNKYRYLIEVKEISVYKGYKSFAFDRLSQEADLVNFETVDENNISFILLNFRGNTLKNSNTFLVPLYIYTQYKKKATKKSINLDEALDKFCRHKLEVLPGSAWDVSKYII